MGDNCCPTTKDKAGSPDSHRKLCLFSVTLVYTVLLRSLTKASIPNGSGDYFLLGVDIIFCIVTRWWCIRRNKLLDEAEPETGEVTGWRYAT